MKALKWIGLALLAIIATPFLLGLTLRAVKPAPPPPGELIDVGGYALHLNCTGPEDSDYTVVFEAGAGVSSPNYYWIEANVSEVARFCIYDRAGLGWSEESGLPRDSETIAKALHRLLDEAGVKRPFVFAGHSIAGLYSRYYIHLYPDEVAGLVLLDPSHPNQTERLGFSPDAAFEKLAAMIRMMQFLLKFGLIELYDPRMTEAAAPWLSDFPAEVQEQIRWTAKRPSNFEAWIRETADFEKAAAQAAANRTLGDLPLIVVSATKPLPEGLYPNGADTRTTQEAIVAMHEDIVSLSTRGEHFEVPTAEHMSLVQERANAEIAAGYIRRLLDRLHENKDGE